jgi:Zn-dependent protease
VNDLETFLYLLPVLLVSLTFHELAHALVATRLGDPTPGEQGRLTLNPLAHIDPLGTAMFALTYFLTGFIFGWAKPVLVDARRFRKPKESMALVAAAGPAVNFLIALGCAGIAVHVDDLGTRTVDVLELAFELNIILGLFNLIPIPPLDGSRIVGALMSNATYARWAALDQYGMLALFAVILLFQNEFFTLFQSAFDHSADVMIRIVGG